MTITKINLNKLGVLDDVAVPLLAYLDALNELDRQSCLPGGRTNVLADSEGRYQRYDVDPDHTGAVKYLRIVMTSEGRNGGSVHSFVDKETGVVIKPAGWRGPAKSTAKATKGQVLGRYDLTDPDSLADLLTKIDAYGSYLYQ